MCWGGQEGSEGGGGGRGGGGGVRTNGHQLTGTGP